MQPLPLPWATANRTQILVLAFVLVALVSVIAIRVAAPDVYDEAFRLPSADRQLETGFLAAVSVLILLLAIAVCGRWRWTFWLNAGPVGSDPATRKLALPF